MPDMYQNLLDCGVAVTEQNRKKSIGRAVASSLLFLGLWGVVFTGTFFLLYEIGIVPQSIAQTGNSFLPAPFLPPLARAAGLYGKETLNNASLNIERASASLAIKLSAVKIPQWVGRISIPSFVGKNAQPAIGELKTTVSAASTAAAFEKKGLTIKEPKGPATLSIPSVDLAADIVFPKSAEVSVLDAALKQGVVHFPYSALPGERGNIFLFGHSTNLPVLEASSYRAFNDIKKLVTGDKIDIIYAGVVYEYRVTVLRIGRAQDITVDFEPEKNILTLSTCWFKGEDWKNQRYVVEAEFVRSYPAAEDTVS